MSKRFDQVAQDLGTSRGGFTLWLGAGVSRAMTRGKTPGWGELVESLVPRGDMSGLAELAKNSTVDFPDRLEAAAELSVTNVFVGHLERALSRRCCRTVLMWRPALTWP